MRLTQAQKALIEQARTPGSGGQAVGLSDSTCALLVGTIAHDFGLSSSFPEISQDLPAVFGEATLDSCELPGVDFYQVLERLIGLQSDADMYFACLANLYKRRLKYDLILRTQPLPTLDQVGPRGLLQYGSISPLALTGLMFWRKWLYDIDNRAGQETGYLFEPIMANAIGGCSVTARRSPVRRHQARSKGRQIDCLRGNRAYEFKIRVTIAASGQGRWREELDFPVDCRESGYTPVLTVLDETPNPKLEELERAFLEQDGEVYIGEAAWQHLFREAGATMEVFLQKYIRKPLEALAEAAPTVLPDMILHQGEGTIVITVGSEALRIDRASEAEEQVNEDGPYDEP